MNTRMGGVNHCVDMRDVMMKDGQAFDMQKTMLIGIDVTHQGSGDPVRREFF